MKRDFGISFLILCFVLSGVNPSLASQAIEVPPVLVEPNISSELNLQMIDLNLVDQDQEMVIKQLIDENQRLSNAASAHRKIAVLQEINKTIANSQGVSQYDELIDLTEDVIKMKNAGQTLLLKKDVLEGKYKILYDLKNEMMTLNKKIKNDVISESLNDMGRKQEEKIRSLDKRLGETNQKIATYDEVLADKNEEIAQLKGDLVRVKSESAAKDETINVQKSQLDLLKSELENKITELNDQGQKDEIIKQQEDKMLQLQAEMQGIKDDFARRFKDYDQFEHAIVSLKDQVAQLDLQLSQKQGQVDQLKDQIKAGQGTNHEAESLKQQLAIQQDKADQLKQELETKISESDQMTLMLSEYQKKLESKDEDYNKQLGQILSLKNYQAMMESQVTELNARLQEKEAQIVKVKKDMYDLQESGSTNEKEYQSKDLSYSVMQQEIIRLKSELDSARQQPKNLPVSDELEFLRTGLMKATAQLKQKDEMILQIKANADEYKREFMKQSGEFQGLRLQLREAQEEIKRKDEDFKEKEKDFQAQVITISKELEATDYESMRNPHANKAEALRAQLKRAIAKIKDLQAQVKELKQFSSPSSNGPLEEKLKQALYKIDEQGRLINVLAKKVQDCGQSVDLTKDADK